MPLVNRTSPSASQIDAAYAALRTQAERALESGDPRRAAAGNAILMGGRELAATLLRLGIAPAAPTPVGATTTSGAQRPWEARLQSVDPLTRTRDYRDAVRHEAAALRQVTLTADLSPAGADAFEAMIAALGALLRPGLPGPQLVLEDPEAKAVVENRIEALVRTTTSATLSPGAARAYEDMIGALRRLVDGE